MLVFKRIEFENPRIGCCGSARKDSISPVGESADLEEFKKEAANIMKNYGQNNSEGYGDEFSVEFFEGENFYQNKRGKGQSILKLALNGGKWEFYKNGEFETLISNPEELESLLER